jgi:hypothetical protein
MRTNVSAEPAAFIFRVEGRTSRFYPEDRQLISPKLWHLSDKKRRIPEDGSFNIQRHEKRNYIWIIFIVAPCISLRHLISTPTNVRT